MTVAGRWRDSALDDVARCEALRSRVRQLLLRQYPELELRSGPGGALLIAEDDRGLQVEVIGSFARVTAQTGSSLADRVDERAWPALTDGDLGYAVSNAVEYLQANRR